MTFKQGRDPPGPFQSNFQSIWVIFGSFWTTLSEEMLSFFAFSPRVFTFFVKFWTQRGHISTFLSSQSLQHRSGHIPEQFQTNFDPYFSHFKPILGPVFPDLVNFMISNHSESDCFRLFKLPKHPRHLPMHLPSFQALSRHSESDFLTSEWSKTDSFFPTQTFLVRFQVF